MLNLLPLVGFLLLRRLLTFEVLNRCRFYTLEAKNFTGRNVALSVAPCCSKVATRWGDLNSLVLHTLLALEELALGKVSAFLDLELRGAPEEVGEDGFALISNLDLVGKFLFESIGGNFKSELSLGVLVAKEIHNLAHVVLQLLLVGRGERFSEPFVVKNVFEFFV